MNRNPITGTVYTETTVYSPPEAFAAEAPYQIALITLDSGPDQGHRVTARIHGDSVSIGDAVELVETRNSIPFFRNRGKPCN